MGSGGGVEWGRVRGWGGCGGVRWDEGVGVYGGVVGHGEWGGGGGVGGVVWGGVGGGGVEARAGRGGGGGCH